MTDYSKLKVADLKEELKNRGIPLTGLKLKQNFIDRLIEDDAAKEASDPAAESAAPKVAEETDATPEGKHTDAVAEPVERPHSAAPARDDFAPAVPTKEGVLSRPQEHPLDEMPMESQTAAFATAAAPASPPNAQQKPTEPKAQSPEAAPEMPAP